MASPALLLPGRGFTLIEVMIVVVILGVLASVAVPALVTYIQRSKTAEAEDKLSVMYRGSVAYVINVNEQVDQGADGTGVVGQFPADEGPTPAGSCGMQPDGLCVPVDGEWDLPTWIDLNFQIADPHRFNYSYESDGVGAGALFTARAQGDLDADGRESTFERCGIITDGVSVRGSRGVFRAMPLE